MKRFFATITILSSCLCASAQNFTTGFFMDNYSYAHRINPAISAERSYAGVLLNNINVGAAGNVGMGNFLFPDPNGGEALVTGLNKGISAEEFLGRLPATSSLNVNVGLNIVSVGVFLDKDRKGFGTFELNSRESAGVNLPKDLFTFLKKGGYRMYDLHNTSSDIKSYFEFAFGYSYKINEKWSVGAKAKFLLGAGSASISSKDLSIGSTGDELAIRANADANIAFGGLVIPTNEKGIYDLDKISVNPLGIGPCGYGAAFDLGATYKPIEDLTISLAVNDLGFIFWNNTVSGHSEANTSWKGSASEIDIFNPSASNGTIGDEIQEALNKLNAVYEFRPVPVRAAAEMIAFNANVGARYKMPFYKRLSAGVITTFDYYKGLFAVDARAGATVTPLDWLSISANIGGGTYGAGYGAALSISGGPINFFLGYEGYIGKAASVGGVGIVPLDKFREKVNLGITVTFGKREVEY